uniref:Ribosomal protein L16 n=1 Tax=Rhodomelopsis africana TaxID=1917047 RepID=UPI0022FD565B|nr:Ribosomal protein L16 [Rhodomelopsis africana]WAX04065.1 Ribosomal protein L16 [Rhodomelopsis africana]
MKKTIFSRKKYHFKFKNTLSFKKHILKFGNMGFKIKNATCLKESQEVLLKLKILKILKKIKLTKTKIFFALNSFYSATKLPLESGMGKGKGEIHYFFGYYKKGFILFELKTIPLIKAMELQKQLNKIKFLSFKIVY